MIICVCNRLNEVKIRGAIASGATTPDEVYGHNGTRKVCGTCHATIEAMLQDARETQEQLQAAE